MSDEKPPRHVCILGTAPTWKIAPFADPSVEIWALNDSWVLNLPRADRWFDLHPLHKMHFRHPGKKVYASDVPAGFFVRPVGHLEWLRKQTIPVYVQDAAALGSPNARTFPREDVMKALGPHFASSPAWMIGLALLEGVTDLHVYGIHLATEWEYQRQKPNMNFLLGVAAGRGIRLHLPKGCPLLTESHQYAFEEDPDVPKVRLQRKAEHLQRERQLIKQRQSGKKWYQRKDPNAASRLAMLNAQLTDVNLGVQHVIAGRPPAGF